MGGGGAVAERPAGGLEGGLAAADGIAAGARARGQQVVFFLDYDGTLSPIVDRPEDARLPGATRATLARLCAHFPVAIVTGRAVPKIKEFVQVDGLMYAGSHGFEIDAPPLGRAHVVAEEHLPTLQKALRALRVVAAGFSGASVEDNRFSVSVHYRLVDPAQLPRFERTVFAESEKLALRVTHGKKVWEVRPDFDWHKGKAVMYLLHELGMDSDGFLPIYIGDDVTDEDAFRSLCTAGGVNVIVFDPEKQAKDCKPRQTLAGLRLRDPVEVGEFLAEFVRTKEAETAEAEVGRTSS